jgi:hypothetical protein
MTRLSSRASAKDRDTKEFCMRTMVAGVLLVWLVSVGVCAPLTETQYATLATDIQSGPNAATLAPFVTARDDQSIALFYNQASAPVVTLWRPNIRPQELHNVVVWTDFVALTAIKQGTYTAMMTGATTIDATNSGIRGAFQAVFGAGSASLTAMTAVAQQPATRLEALFSTASGGANISTVFGELLTHRGVAHALRGVPLQ